MSMPIRCMHTETYTFDNTPAGRKAAKKVIEMFSKRDYGTVWRNDHHDAVAVTHRGEIEFEGDRRDG